VQWYSDGCLADVAACTGNDWQTMVFVMLGSGVLGAVIGRLLR